METTIKYDVKDVFRFLPIKALEPWPFTNIPYTIASRIVKSDAAKAIARYKLNDRMTVRDLFSTVFQSVISDNNMQLTQLVNGNVVPIKAQSPLSFKHDVQGPDMLLRDISAQGKLSLIRMAVAITMWTIVCRNQLGFWPGFVVSSFYRIVNEGLKAPHRIWRAIDLSGVYPLDTVFDNSVVLHYPFYNVGGLFVHKAISSRIALMLKWFQSKIADIDVAIKVPSDVIFLLHSMLDAQETYQLKSTDLTDSTLQTLRGKQILAAVLSPMSINRSYVKPPKGTHLRYTGKEPNNYDYEGDYIQCINSAILSPNAKGISTATRRRWQLLAIQHKDHIHLEVE